MLLLLVKDLLKLNKHLHSNEIQIRHVDKNLYNNNNVTIYLNNK